MANINDNKIVAVIQARMGSTRLPSKALKKIEDRTLIAWIKYRLSFCKGVDQIVLSTADTEENDVLAKHAEEIGLEYFRGNEADIVTRLLETAKKFKADAIIRVTGDCPLVDPGILDEMIKVYRENINGADLVTNIFPPTFPDGIDLEIIPFKTLERLNWEVNNSLYREWITTTIMENADKYRILNISNEDNLQSLRLTVDYPEDFQLVKEIFFKLHKEGNIFGLSDILELFAKEPALININKNRVDNGINSNIRSEEFHNLKLELNNNN